MTDLPNIILVTADQLQAFATGCYGNAEVQTPHIDALAASGIRFDLGISNAPVCMAARSCLLSGQYNRTCTGGVYNVHYPGGKVGSYPMPEYPPPDRLHIPNPCLPELLQDAGYHTAAIGKWHIYAWPDALGFDHYVIPRTHHAHSAQPYVENGGPEFVPDGWSVEYETKRAVDYIQQRAGAEAPFFLYLNFSPPHPPISDAPERYLRMYDPLSLTLRDNVDEANAFPSEDDIRTYRWDYRFYELQLPYTRRPMAFSIRDIYAAYYGNVTWVDEQVGQVMAMLERAGLRENTLVVFTADHGDNLGSHGRCGKGLPYDESLRVPMIYSRPGTYPPAVVGDGVAGLVDIAPTLLAAAGIDPPSHMFGRDVLGDGPAPFQFIEIVPGDIALRSTRYTAHFNRRAATPVRSVFDNESDPSQMTNVYTTEDPQHSWRELFDPITDFDERTLQMPEPDYGFTSH